jgi:hypothetical protein
MIKLLKTLCIAVILLACDEEGDIPREEQKSKLFSAMVKNNLSFANGGSKTFSTSGGLSFADPFTYPTNSCNSTTSVTIEGQINELDYTGCFYSTAENYFGIGGTFKVDNFLVYVSCYIRGRPESGIYSVGFYENAIVGISVYQMLGDGEYSLEAIYYSISGNLKIDVGNTTKVTFANVLLEDYYSGGESTIHASGSMECCDVFYVDN